MPKVISDTSVLILFLKIEEFAILKQVYGSLITTPEIAKEFFTTAAEGVPIAKTSKVFKLSGAIS